MTDSNLYQMTANRAARVNAYRMSLCSKPPRQRQLFEGHHRDSLAHEVDGYRYGKDRQTKAANEQHESYGFLHRARLSLGESHV